MRLSEYEQQSIKETFANVFQQGKIYLFGSRVDDSKKGGDIDLYIEPEKKESLSSKKIDFLVQLKRAIGEQKIDVVIDRGENRLIDTMAKEKRVLLWKS
ncbi:MAG: nucleotidyltransferase domain-containing protein [Campylobacterales bacterium]|nr:nucleotidyltransferase domain-containing protein [Campylobacterales bacterium]